ncbi:MAG: antitoxin [Nocardioidaceae bacterium]|nr:antitoxin [Nocardioidaceae bacterium]
MRTTVTLDPDVETVIKRVMRERGVTFKEAVNDAIRAGATGPGRPPPKAFPTHDMGEPIVDVTKALRLAGELEDQDLAARLTRGA